MKRFISFIAGLLVYTLAVILLSGYGHDPVHKTINQAIVESFGKKFLDGIFTIEKFKNYVIVFDGSLGFKGPQVTSGGLFSVNETVLSNNFKNWVIHGGFSADEPQLHASFRHFFDPTEKPGERHLKDHLDYLVQKTGFGSNPRIDHIEWALKHPEHTYNWANGIDFVKKALETDDVAKRDEYMAKAYRCLGETLHMIADMGCPPHVRDDSHPGLSFDPGLMSYFGIPDPYEESFEKFAGNISTWAGNAVDGDLKSFFRTAGTVEAIAIRMARYTNENFFTNQTISGKSVTPQIHPEKTYLLPKLEDCRYDAPTYTYKKMVSGTEVNMCKDLTYLYKIVEWRGYPYIDQECAASQGAVLIPQIVEAGANVIRLFIPQLTVEILSYSNDTVKGKVTHKTDGEYKSEIKYNGKVNIVRAKDLKKVGEAVAKDGKFEGVVKIDEGEKMLAEVSFGDITVKSVEFQPATFSYVMVHLKAANPNIDFMQVTQGSSKTNISTFAGFTNWYGGLVVKPLTWVGNKFSTEFTYNLNTGQFTSRTDVKIEGEIDPTSKKLKTFKGSNYLTFVDIPGVFQKFYIQVDNVPVSITSSGITAEISGSSVKNYVTSYSLDDSNGSKITSVNWANVLLQVSFLKK